MPDMTVDALRSELQRKADPDRARNLQWFFKTGPGEYGEGDILLHDPEDLIQKAVGWMLREVRNRALTVEEEFLRPRHTHMPRTMPRYAIEKFPEGERRTYLSRWAERFVR